VPEAPLPPLKPLVRRSAPVEEEKIPLKQWLPVAGFLTLLGIGAAAAIYFGMQEIRQPEPPPAPSAADIADEAEVRENHYIRFGWRKDAARVLEGFIAANSPRDKLPFVLGGESMSQRLADFYGTAAIDDSDTPAAAFSVFELSEDDRRRGLFLMIYDQPPQIDMREFFKPLAPLEVQYGLEEADILLNTVARTSNFAMEPLRVQAFFKRTPDGLKLDWETFVQTKYRLFQSFTDLPEPGRKAVFRVLIIEDVPDAAQTAAGQRAYLLADPVHRDHSARVAVTADSEIGRALEVINWRGRAEAQPRSRTATVELAWTADNKAPVLTLSRFICWEFLGLGGNESGNPQNPE
jgi:hypothetical protein